MSRRIASMVGCLLLMAVLAGPGMAQEKPTVVSHDLAGKENCMMCHTAGAMQPVPDVPADHEGRGNETCMWCHAADSPMQTEGATPTSHDLEGKENCLMCHTAGAMEPVPDVPESHGDRGNETCLWCHVKAGIQ